MKVFLLLPISSGCFRVLRHHSFKEGCIATLCCGAQASQPSTLARRCSKTHRRVPNLDLWQRAADGLPSGSIKRNPIGQDAQVWTWFLALPSGEDFLSGAAKNRVPSTATTLAGVSLLPSPLPGSLSSMWRVGVVKVKSAGDDSPFVWADVFVRRKGSILVIPVKTRHGEPGARSASQWPTTVVGFPDPDRRGQNSRQEPGRQGTPWSKGERSRKLRNRPERPQRVSIGSTDRSNSLRCLLTRPEESHPSLFRALLRNDATQHMSQLKRRA